jgi:hypothetical protein
MYIHEKFRQAGHKALCLPSLKWGHRFGRPNGVPYVKILTRWNKIRNYVIGANELGLPLDRIYEHFVTGKLMHQWEWDQLTKDPIALEAGPVVPPGFIPPGRLPPQRPQPRATISDVGELQAWVKGIKRDLNEHIDKISEYASKCKIVGEVTHRRESTVALLSAEKVISLQREQDPLLQRILDVFPGKVDLTYLENLKTVPPLPQKVELLFLDTIGTSNRLTAELTLYHKMVEKYIIVHDTAVYGERGEDGGPGLLHSLRMFMKEYPEWSVVYHTKDQYGLTIISRVAEEKPKLPSVFTMAANFAKASADFVADSMRTVSKEEYDARLGVCSMCPQRNENSCSVCGCNLSAKAKGRAFDCPLLYWPKVTSESEHATEVHQS